MKVESGEAADFLGHGSASGASAKTHASKLRVPCTTLRSPWLLCRRGFAKTFDEWIVKNSPQSGQATEAGSG
ncbi:Chemotaxis protein MotB [Pseudomonas cichorii]|nr:Chemotaxis protein MotB [Pseudomonas cichorii]